jgi:hypothetical protein
LDCCGWKKDDDGIWIQSENLKIGGEEPLVLTFNGHSLYPIPTGPQRETILIILPGGFPIIDLILIDLRKEPEAVIFLIQITISKNPLASHKTPVDSQKGVKQSLKLL